MKRKMFWLAGAALIALGAGAEASELRGTYFAVEGGGSWIGDERFLVQYLYPAGLPSSSNLEAGFDTGWSAFASIGYAFAGGWRAELEGGYRHNDVDRLTSGGATITPTGEIGQFTIMANILYDIELSKRLT